MSYLQETQDAGREIFPDLARAFALIGIALVNVGMISYPSMTSYFGGGLSSSIDEVAFSAVNALFLMKSYTLFSFMFGVGFAYQMASAEKRGIGFSGRYWRRIIGLLIFGFINIAFLFQGDILVIYAILGCILFLFRKSSPRVLSGWGIGIYLFQVVIMALLAVVFWSWSIYEPNEFAAEMSSIASEGLAEAEAYRSGTFTETIAQRFLEWTEVITFGLLLQSFGALAFFLFGLSAVKRGTITNPGAPFWKTCRWVYLPIGLIISGTGAWLTIRGDGFMDTNMMFGMTLIMLGAPFSTAGYLGLIAKWSETSGGALKTFLARGGTVSLTAYLMQGLLLSLIFNAYGLGLFEQIGAAGCVAIAFGVALFTVAFTSLWRTKFKRGPLEAILRSWTYLGAR
ncbi:MAG: DUF418 domain-containing protein [Pseudomonadota bacterium]